VSWGEPGFFTWLWIGPLFWFLFFLLGRYRRRLLRRFGDASLVQQMSLSFSPSRRFLKQILLITALLLVVISLAKPQVPGGTVLVKRRGIDIVIAVDVSSSMLAEDILPSRLEKAKLELQELVEKSKGDRIGIVAFSGDAFVQVPLTTDRAAVKLFLKTLDPSIIPTPGTEIGHAIETAMDMFVEEETEHKAILLLTDGEDQGSHPLKASRRAAKAGIKIYAIGIGTSKGEMIPVRRRDGGIEFKKDAKGNIVVSRLDEKTLKNIAKISGGVYYRSRRGNLEVDRIYRDMRGLGRKETGTEWVVEYKPLYQITLALAVFIIFLEMCVPERRRIP